MIKTLSFDSVPARQQSAQRELVRLNKELVRVEDPEQASLLAQKVEKVQSWAKGTLVPNTVEVVLNESLGLVEE